MRFMSFAFFRSPSGRILGAVGSTTGLFGLPFFSSSFFPSVRSGTAPAGAGMLAGPPRPGAATAGRHSFLLFLSLPRRCARQEPSWRPSRRRTRLRPLFSFFRRCWRPPSKVRRETAFNQAKACFFSLFFLLFSGPVVRQDQARVDLAVKARFRFFVDRMSLFFLAGGEGGGGRWRRRRGRRRKPIGLFVTHAVDESSMSESEC